MGGITEGNTREDGRAGRAVICSDRDAEGRLHAVSVSPAGSLPGPGADLLGLGACSCSLHGRVGAWAAERSSDPCCGRETLAAPNGRV